MKRILLLIVSSGLFLSHLLFGQQVTLKPSKVQLPEAYMTTIPLRDMKVIPPAEKSDWKNGIIPNKDLTPAQRNKTGKEPPVYGPDPALQKEYSDPNPLAKSVLQNFEGVGNLCNCAPPDPNGDVGPNHYIQMVNDAFQIFDKAGNPISSPADLSTIWDNLPGPWSGTSDGDPIVLYDELADRWLLTQFSLPNYPSGPFYELIAVSETSDPTGAYHLYAYSYSNLPDYPKFGVWPDGYYMSINQFSPGSFSWAGAGAVVFERDQMLLGNAAQMVMFSFTPAQDPWSFLPADVDGVVPPLGTPNYFVYLEDVFTNGTDRLRIHELSVDWTNTDNSTFTGPVDLNVDAFNPSVSGIPQPGTTQTLDPLSSRLMYRLQYRNFGTYQTLVTNHTVNAGSGAGIRWYELRNSGSGWSVYQQGTYAPSDGNQRWMGSVAMNGTGDIALGYSIAGGISPSINYTGRKAGDPLGTMTIPETTVITGSGAQTGTNRWGDYSAMVVDPTDDFTFWYTQEYVNPGGNFAWRTRIASFELYPPSVPPVADFEADNTMPIDATVTVNFDDLSTMSPTSWSWSFTPSTITFVGGTTAASQNPKVQFNNPGAYSVSLTAANEFGSNIKTKTGYIHMGNAGFWTGSTDSDWSTPTNWENHLIPDASTDITISETAINWPVFTGDFSIGSNCNGIELIGNSQLTISGNLTIETNKILSCNADAVIHIGRDWTNNGTFNPGSGKVIFDGSLDGIVHVAPAGSATTFLIDEDFGSGLGSWNGAIGAGSLQYNTTSSSFAGGISPELRYTSGSSAGTTNRIYHNAINTSGLTSVDLSFRHMVDHANNGGNPYTIKIEYSLDGISWLDAGWSVSPTSDIPATVVSVTLDNAQGIGSASIYVSFTITGNVKRINYWYLDDVQLSYTSPISGEEIFYDLTISKSNAGITTNGDIAVNNNLTVIPGAYFTNASDNNIVVQGDLLLEADETSMASFIDNGTTTVTGDAIVEQYLAYDAGLGYQHHLVSSPISNATLNSYYNLYFYAYDEAGTDGVYWDNIYDPLDYPLTMGKGYTVTGSPGYTGATTAVFNTGSGGVLNNSDVSYSDFSLDCTDLNYVGFELVGNPFQSALEWNTNWNSVGLSGWMLVWDKDTYRGYHTDGTSYQSGTPYIPSTQGFFVRATTLPASITIPASERVHNSQSFYKQTGDYPYPILRLEAESNKQKDECVVVFHPEGHWGFDGYYDLSKFTNAITSPKIYTVSEEKSYGFNVLPPDYEDAVVPLHFEIPSPGIYQLEATEINKFSDNINIYLEDLKERSVTELKTNPYYEFSYHPLDDPHRFNLHFKESFVETQVIGGSDIRVYAFGNRVYVHTPAHQPGKISVYGLLGQEILTANAVKEGYTVLELTNGTGYYLVRVQTKQESLGKKVFISQ